MAACLACTSNGGRAAARATSAIVSNPVRGPTEDSFERWIVVEKTRFDGRQSDPSVFYTRLALLPLHKGPRLDRARQILCPGAIARQFRTHN